MCSKPFSYIILVIEASDHIQSSGLAHARALRKGPNSSGNLKGLKQRAINSG
jgi:hypothetical protein